MVRRCRPRPTGSASPWASGPISTTISPPAGLLRPSRPRYPRACAGTWSIAATAPSSATSPLSAAGSSVPRPSRPRRASAMPAERVGTLVIGGGQAGLAMSHHLKRRGLDHLVLERGRVGERWRSERWDGLKFQFPNWSVRLPDFPFPHSDPDGFADLSTILDFIDDYAGFVAPPIRCGVEVTRLSQDGAGFVAETSDGAIAADNVVVAPGPYQRPLHASPFADSGLFQVHASQYRN